MGQIKVTPQELYDLSRALKQNAGELSQLASRIKNNVNTRTANWEGQSKESYINNFNDLYPTLSTKLPQLLEAMAKDIKLTADDFDNLDKRRGR